MPQVLEKRGNNYYDISSEKAIFQCSFNQGPFRFCTSEWQLRSRIEADEKEPGEDDLWVAAMPRKPSPKDLWGVGTVLPLHFNRDVQKSLVAEIGKKFDLRIGIINENGVRPFTGNINIYLNIEDTANGFVWHSSAEEGGIRELRE